MLKELMLPLAAIGTLSLSACSTPSVIIEHQTIILTEPEIYQHCLTEPLPPPSGATNKQWSDYQLELKRYGNDCEGKVIGGREWTKRHSQELQPEKEETYSNRNSQPSPETSLWDKLWGNKAEAPKKD
jgi:hypothetical protein